MKLIDIGFGNLVSDQRLVAVLAPESAPIKRTISDAKSRGMLVDASYGRKTQSVLVMDSGHVVLSAMEPAVVAAAKGV
jgi:Uncharacterized protein conserved in bacteria